MINALFTYGSLMFPEVWEKVLQGSYERTRGTACGYARYSVSGMTYPGMIAQAGSSVDGVVYFDISDDDLAILDAFEGENYQRRSVALQLADGRRIEAQTYLFLEPEELSNQPWDPEQFAMQRFLQSYL